MWNISGHFLRKQNRRQLENETTQTWMGFGVSFGPSFGIGIRIPMKKIEGMVKVDYKLGIYIFPDNEEGSYLSPQHFRLVVGIRKPNLKAR